MSVSLELKRVLRSSIGLSARFVSRLHKASGNGLTIFCFHDVTDAPTLFAEHYGLASSPSVFRLQVAWITENFDVVHPQDLIRDVPLPRRAALITFDDGFVGAFENGIRWLVKQRLPSVMFLNMRTVLEQEPMLSAIACYLDRYAPHFAGFAESHGIKRPFHLTLTPAALTDFEKRYGTVDRNAVLEYQGKIAALSLLKSWDGEDCVTYGNHLFDHWNAAALAPEELEEQYTRNEMALSRLKNHVNLFAFPNGQPGTCFSARDVDCLAKLHAARLFSSAGGVNLDSRSYLLDRIGLGDRDKTENQMWYRYARGRLKGRLRTRVWLPATLPTKVG